MILKCDICGTRLEENRLVYYFYKILEHIKRDKLIRVCPWCQDPDREDLV